MELTDTACLLAAKIVTASFWSCQRWRHEHGGLAARDGKLDKIREGYNRGRAVVSVTGAEGLAQIENAEELKPHGSGFEGSTRRRSCASKGYLDQAYGESDLPRDFSD